MKELKKWSGTKKEASIILSANDGDPKESSSGHISTL